MPTLKALKSRSEGIEKINKITRAMEVIAANRHQRYAAAALRFRAFVDAQRTIAGSLAQNLKKVRSQWVGAEDSGPSLVILISSDRGFCGGFNNQLFQLVRQSGPGENTAFISVGKKAGIYLKRRRLNLVAESALPDEANLEGLLQNTVQQVLSAYRQRPQKVHLIFNQFRKNILGRPGRRQVFPLEAPQAEKISADYLFEPDIESIVERFLSIYVHSEIKAAILESKAAEEMARMVAMSQATRSAQDLIKRLTLQYHKARQAGITRELIEVVNASA